MSKKKLRESKGVQAIRLLGEDEKKLLLKTETIVEDKIVWSMCSTLNEGIREAIQRDYTIATVMNTSIFEYPHHPLMKMLYNGIVVGEQIPDLDMIVELKKDRTNFFLWEDFVIYIPRLPMEKGAKQKLRLVYLKREAPQLEGIPCVERGVIGIPSSEGDALIKEILSFPSQDPMTGSCLLGFNIKDPQ